MSNNLNIARGWICEISKFIEYNCDALLLIKGKIYIEEVEDNFPIKLKVVGIVFVTLKKKGQFC